MNEVRPHRAITDVTTPQFNSEQTANFVEWGFIYFENLTYIDNLVMNICISKTYHYLSDEEAEQVNMDDYPTPAGKEYLRRLELVRSFGIDTTQTVVYQLIRGIAREFLEMEV